MLLMDGCPAEAVAVFSPPLPPFGVLADLFMIVAPRPPPHPPIGGPHSRAEEAEGYDRDSVLAAVRLRAGGEHGRVEQLVADLVAQPAQMLDVLIIDRGGQLHLERQHTPAALD